MSAYAPPDPTTHELHNQYALPQEAYTCIAENRTAIADTIAARRAGFIAVVGPCAMTEDQEVLRTEGRTLARMQDVPNGLIVVHRAPLWKPRTDKDAWHGLETEQQTVGYAFRMLNELAAANANTAIEIGYAEHLPRYAGRLTLGWLGSRNDGKRELAEAAALHDPGLPLGIKNGLDGNIAGALETVRTVNRLRGAGGAPAILIFRGGDTLQTPQAWEEAYRLAYRATNGTLIVDTAHGSEMAHDPTGEFKKSVLGQLACMKHVLRIANDYGEVPLGVMVETSGAPSPTDPVVSFGASATFVRAMHRIANKRGR